MNKQTTQLEFYEPELLGVLQDVFDLAWQKLNSTAECPLHGDVEQRRRDLAQMIILAHRGGMTPEEIEDAILKQGRGVKS